MINLLLGLGAALVVMVASHFLHISPWLYGPLGLGAGFALFVWLGRKVQQALEAIFTRAGELLNRPQPQFDKAIEIMKEGYRYGPRQFMVKGSVDGQIGMIQYLRDKNAEAEPLLKSASLQHYMAKAMLGILQWKRGEKKASRATFELALKTGKKESLLYAVYAYVLNEMGDRNKAIDTLNKGLSICKGDERLEKNRNLLQNAKPMKMQVYGAAWYQFKLERPKMQMEAPPYAKISRRALRG